MRCEFEESEDGYACRLQIHNPDGLSTGVFDDVEGDHLPGRGDEDVTLLTAFEQNSR